MKNSLALTAKTLMVALSATMMVACAPGNDKTADNTAASSKADASTTDKALPNYRYIDADSVSANYNLAKDFKEAALRTFSKLESAQNAKAAEIQRAGAKIEEKMRSNYYVGKESEYNADVERLNKMQRDAENYLANLQRSSQQEMAQQQVELNDSLVAFLNDYIKDKGYDAVFYKAAAAYIDPALDITEEVTEGLNARYNKVKVKK